MGSRFPFRRHFTVPSILFLVLMARQNASSPLSSQPLKVCSRYTWSSVVAQDEPFFILKGERSLYYLYVSSKACKIRQSEFKIYFSSDPTSNGSMPLAFEDETGILWYRLRVKYTFGDSAYIITLRVDGINEDFSELHSYSNSNPVCRSPIFHVGLSRKSRIGKMCNATTWSIYSSTSSSPSPPSLYSSTSSSPFLHWNMYSSSPSPPSLFENVNGKDYYYLSTTSKTRTFDTTSYDDNYLENSTSIYATVIGVFSFSIVICLRLCFWRMCHYLRVDRPSVTRIRTVTVIRTVPGPTQNQAGAPQPMPSVSSDAPPPYSASEGELPPPYSKDEVKITPSTPDAEEITVPRPSEGSGSAHNAGATVEAATAAVAEGCNSEANEKTGLSRILESGSRAAKSQFEFKRMKEEDE